VSDVISGGLLGHLGPLCLASYGTYYADFTPYKRCWLVLKRLFHCFQGTVRVPAPCLYAHKLAFLVGQSIHDPVSAELSDKLYFL